ncbi:MAG: hypothetical protein AAGJ52_06450 [Pseudomonadota bacterium]
MALDYANRTLAIYQAAPSVSPAWVSAVETLIAELNAELSSSDSELR